MKSDCFLDTNILIYAAAGRKSSPEKFAVAASLVSNERFGLSAQVLAEFYVNVTSRPAIALSPTEATEWVDLLSSFPIAAVDDVLVRQAVAYSRRFRITYWDAAIVAAAERLQAAVLYSEDLNHGQLYSGVRVINPFREDSSQENES